MILDASKPESINQAALVIQRGGLVGMPTETVYGLAASVFNDQALQKIYDVKKRDIRDPLIVHLSSADQVEQVAEVAKRDLFDRLAKAFWPGPLTLVLPKKANVSNLVTSNLPTIAVRVPNHSVARALLDKVGPLAAPSANRFQSLSPTTAKAVADELGEQVEIILDAGPCKVGVESTIVSLVDTPRVLRLGGIPVEALEAVLGKPLEVVLPEERETLIQAPGMMSFHYAPKKPLHVFEPHALRVHIDLDPAEVKSWGLLCFSPKSAEPFKAVGFQEVAVLSGAGDLEEAARNFFSTLRRLDQGGCSKIAALKMPETGLGRAINDRLQKAQHG